MRGHRVLSFAAAAAVLVLLCTAATQQLGAATNDVSTPSLTLEGPATVTRGTQVTFDYATPASQLSSTNWVGFYPDGGATPGNGASTTWQYAPDASGTVSFDTNQLASGTWDAYYLYNDGYTALAAPVTLTVTGSTTPAPPTVPLPYAGPNLIVNGGAEIGEGSLVGVDTNTVPGWDVTGLLNGVAYGATGGNGVTGYPDLTTPGPVDRGQNFFSGGGGGTSTGTQTADVSEAARAIDRGKVTYTLSGWLGGTGALSDSAQLTSTFLGRHDRVLGSATLPPVTPAMRNSVTELLQEHADGTIPAGTRTIRTVLTVVGPQPTDRSGHGQGYADDLSLTISAPIAVPPAPVPVKARVPGYDHVFVVMMENQNYDGIIGNSRAPYLNTLVPKGADLRNAIAETHPSDPNYIAFAGGSLFGVSTNSPFTSTVKAQHIGDLVTNAGGTWRGYMENANGPCDTTAHGAYTIDDLPFYFFQDVKGNLPNCQRHLVPLTQMTTDLASASTTPTFSWLSADDCDDMEGCGVTAGDTWLSNTLPTIFNSPAWKTQRSLMIITFDEDEANGQQQLERIPTIVLGSQGVRAGSHSNVRYTHYSMLRTIEAALNLTSLTKNDEYATPINDIWTRGRW